MKIYIGMDGDTARRSLEVGVVAPLPWPMLRELVQNGQAGEHDLQLAREHADKNSIELTTAYAPANANMLAGDDRSWGIVEVETDDLDPLLLAPCSVWLRGFLMHRGRAGWMRLAELEAPDVDGDRLRAHAPLFRHLWRESVEAVGRCSYAGPIDPRAIGRVAIFDPTSNRELGYEVNTTWDVGEHRVLGPQQVALTEWFFRPVAARRLLDSVEQHLVSLPPDDLPDAFWLAEAARNRLASCEDMLGARAGLKVLTR